MSIKHKFPLVFTLLGLAFIGAGYYLTAGIMAGRPDVPGIDVVYRPINKPQDIVAPVEEKVIPVAYTKVTSLADLPVDKKKVKFFHMLLPAVLISQHKLETQRRQVSDYAGRDNLDDDERNWLNYMLKKYRADDTPALLRRMESHPASIVLAQAAIETGWGSSRFFRQANNIFGVWSFNADEPRIKAREGRGSRDIYLTIARGPYQAFRTARQESGDPMKLVRHLTRYSELGAEYVRRLQQLIRYNNLTRFDTFEIDPEYRISTRKEG